MSKTIEEILAPKPEDRPRIYAYSIDDQPHAPAPTARTNTSPAAPWVFDAQYLSSPERAAQSMSRSLARLHIHLIFSAKHRQRLLTDTVRDPLHASYRPGDVAALRHGNPGRWPLG